MKNKIWSLILVVVTLVSVIPVSNVNAATPIGYSEELYECIVSSLEEGNLTVDVSEYGMKVSQISDVTQDIHDREPQLFYIKGGCRYSYSGNNVYTLNFSYSITDETEREAAIKFVNDELDKIVATLPTGLDDYEKALYFNDYLCVNYQYDTDFEIYDVYNMLKNKKGVCQAYTGVYDLLLERVGITNSTAATSDHIWNLIEFNNEWYHIDVTWDDPIEDTFGRACHDNFFYSDKPIETTHGTFKSNYDADDASYDSFDWHDYSVSFGFANGKTYMIDDGNIKEVDILTGVTGESLYYNDVRWSYGNYYYRNLSGFGSYKDKLIFNTDKSIMAFDPKTGEAEVVATPAVGGGKLITGSYVSGDTVYYRYGDYTDSDLIGSVTLDFEEENPCDVNGDGKLNMFDYMVVKTLYFNGSDDEALLERADVNGDGKLNMFDYMAVKRAYFEV